MSLTDCLVDTQVWKLRDIYVGRALHILYPAPLTREGLLGMGWGDNEDNVVTLAQFPEI